VGRFAPVPSSRIASVRARSWALVERTATRHARLTKRFPHLTRVLNAGVRAAFLAYSRLELPRYVGLLEAAIVAFPGAWKREGLHECRARWHRYALRLDLGDYFQRWAYFLRHYHEVPVQLLIWRAVRGGDTVIDAGANNGLLSLLSAWRVGPTGRVFALEPNPIVFQQLSWHITRNRLTQVTPIPVGLSDRDEEMILRVPGRGNLGAGTFSPVPTRYGGEVSQQFNAHLVRGDSLTDLSVAGSLLIKMDVEGFELRALRGLEALTARHKPLVIAEVNAEMLAMAGTCPRALFDFMGARGYQPFEFLRSRRSLRSRSLILRAIDPRIDRIPSDVAWIHPESIFWDRLRQMMERPTARTAN